MAEKNVISIGSDLHNLGKATHIELFGKTIKIDYGFNQKIINYTTELLAADAMELIDAAIEAAVNNDDNWYTYNNQRFHTGAVTSIEKRDVGSFGSSKHSLIFSFDNTIREVDFLSDKAARDVVYDAIKAGVEAGTDAALWVEDDGGSKLINFDNIAVINRVNDTKIRIEHAGGGIDDVFSYPDKATLDSDISSWTGDVATASVSATVDSPLVEGTLDGSVITLTLVNDTFVDDTLSGGNFTLNNAPTGVTVDTVTWIDDNTAELALAFDGTDFSVDVTNFNISIAAAELNGGNILTSKNLTVAATIATITVDPAMTEANLDGSVVVMTLANEAYAAGVAAGDFTLNNEPTGTTIDSIERVSDTVVNITLAFDATDFDVDVTTFNITVGAAGVEGEFDVTSDDLTITAIVE